MLVLSRRTGQTICFPTIDTTIELLEVQGSVVRLGIDAPRSLKVLRGELIERSQQPAEPAAGVAQCTAARRMNSAAIGLEMLRRQRAAGQWELAEATLTNILAEMAGGALDKSCEALRSARSMPSKVSPSPVQHSALVVEDDAGERNMLADFLRLSGYRVDVAGDGGEAMDFLATASRPDIMLVDMLMPGVDGPATVAAVRRNPALAGLKIFAVSGTCPAVVGVETGPRGIDRWFPKPLDPEELVSEMTLALAAG